MLQDSSDWKRQNWLYCTEVMAVSYKDTDSKHTAERFSDGMQSKKDGVSGCLLKLTFGTSHSGIGMSIGMNLLALLGVEHHATCLIKRTRQRVVTSCCSTVQ